MVEAEQEKGSLFFIIQTSWMMKDTILYYERVGGTLCVGHKTFAGGSYMQVKKIGFKGLSLFFAGIAITFFTVMPLFILGENSIIPVHDQLDITVLDYILSARHFGEISFLEFMNGSASVTLNSPATLLFYLFFDPYWAFVINYMFVTLVAFCGMFLCLQELFDNPWISLPVSFLFSQLPFFSALGLSAMGQPLLVLFCVRIWKEKHELTDYLWIALFCAFSSPVYGGYASCAFMFLFLAFLVLRKHPQKRAAATGSFLLAAMYVFINFSLILEMFFSPDYISNRVEYKASSMLFEEAFFDLWENGQYHAASLHRFILLPALLCLIVCLLFFRKANYKNRVHIITFVYFVLTAFGIALLYALFHWAPIVELRSRLGGIFLTFQFDRFYFLYPCIWYIILGYVLYFIQLPKGSKFVTTAKVIFSFALLFNVGKMVYNADPLRINFKQILRSEKMNAVTWNEFYSPELFSEIEESIGKEKSEYRVASIGLFPTVALYNGFYCIDGYSYNYNLSYKHGFREIVSAELGKNDSMRSYFDDWGNRCYIFVDQIYGDYQIDKTDERILTELELNTKAMKELGCEYIFSALPIESPYMIDLVLMGDFVREDSPYHIYVYKI